MLLFFQSIARTLTIFTACAKKLRNVFPAARRLRETCGSVSPHQWWQIKSAPDWPIWRHSTHLFRQQKVSADAELLLHDLCLVSTVAFSARFLWSRGDRSSRQLQIELEIRGTWSGRAIKLNQWPIKVAAGAWRHIHYALAICTHLYTTQRMNACRAFI